MKTEVIEKMLRDAGIAEDKIKAVVDNVMAENGKDIAAEQAKTTAKEGEMATATQTIKDLRDTVKKYDGKDPVKLENDLKELQLKQEKEIAKIKLNSALDIALLGTKVKDTKSVRPHLNMDLIKLDGDKILGLDEQIKTIKENKAFLFEDENAKPTVKGAKAPGEPGDDKPKGITKEQFLKMSYKDRINLYNTDKESYDLLSGKTEASE